MIDIKLAKQNPAQYFARPIDVVNAKGLRKRERIEILHRWEFDAKQLEVATEENMLPVEGAPEWLHEIQEALLALGSGSEANPAGSKLG